ncbi:MAG: M20 family metallopeptidase [Rhodospirillales bacterium]|nr:M20 family metallopeptidase [Rhodospirillales bacterium]
MNSGSDNTPRIDAVEILAGIRKWVEFETPSETGAAVSLLVDEVAAHAEALGASVGRRPGHDGFGDLLVVRSPWGGNGPGILVLSHLDTVHPIGTLENDNPFRWDGDKVFGPGIFDMKSGAYLALYALQHLVRTGSETPLPITFMFIPDEEIGSPTTRAEIEAAGRANKYVLVTEPAHGGLCCTGRKGVMHATIKAHGKPAHGGSRHQDGRSAIHELAHQIVRLEAMTDYDKGVTVNTGLMSGGSFINVVPAYAEAKVCIRAWDAETLDQLRETVLTLSPVTPDVRLEITAEINRPVFPRSEGTIKLYEHTRAICKDLGFELNERQSGGGSDGNFTAALGIPTLDGLGADGHGHHTLDEYILFSSLEPRAHMWLRLFETLK